MRFDRNVSNYLSELQDAWRTAINTGEATAELSYRPVLDSFFRSVANSINPAIDLIFEPKIQRTAGRPDWRFSNRDNYGVYGYVEAKGLDPERPIDITDHQDQVRKYLSLGKKVILTDGLEFVFFHPTRGVETRINLISKPIRVANWDRAQVDLSLEVELHQFLQDPGFRFCSEERLVEEIAGRCVYLSQAISNLAQAPKGSGLNIQENQAIDALYDLKELLRNHHDPMLANANQFAEFVAQVLSFGLLYAHRVVVGIDDLPMDRYRKLQEFWTDEAYEELSERLLPFRALIGVVSGEFDGDSDVVDTIRSWYDDSRRLLAYVDLEERQRITPNYHTLYERFFRAFDPKTRFDYGAYYTPRELADFTVRLTKEIVDDELPGLSLYETGNKLIDPCCGTGTFIEQLLQHSPESQEDVHIIGFEILPAPYALAQYRMAMLRAVDRCPNEVSIVLTNTLSNDLHLDVIERKADLAVENLAPSDAGIRLLEREQALARELAAPPLILIIGNPPSSDSFKARMTGANFSIIQDLLNDWRPPTGRRTARQNTQKQLQNDFIKFLRWACDKTSTLDKSIISLILPSSFADHESYRYAREWLLQRYKKLWVMEIDLDSRTGVCTYNIFRTLQGRMLLIGLRDAQGQDGVAPQINYSSLTNLTQREKLDELGRERQAGALLDMFTPLEEINPTTFQFSSQSRPYDRALYDLCWPLYERNIEPTENEKCIFLRHCSGIKLAPSNLLVHVDKNLLLRRSMELAQLNIPIDELKTRWFSGQRRMPPNEKLTDNIRRSIGEAVLQPENIRAYAYRPMLTAYVLISEPVLTLLRTAGGGGTRYRPELMAAYGHQQTIGLAVAPSRKDIGEKLHRFATFCWTLPDNDLCSRGNARVLCNRFPAYGSARRDWNPALESNLAPRLTAMLGATGIAFTDNDIVFFSYGILSSYAYLNAFEGALYTLSGDDAVPRIPVPNDPLLFESISRKGRELADLERPEVVIDLGPPYDAQSQAYTQPFNLGNWLIDPNSELLQLQDDQAQTRLTVTGIPSEVLTIEMSGYEVVDQWLKFHSLNYARRQFSAGDYAELLQLLARIQAQIDIIRSIDEDVSRILRGEVGLL